MKALINDHLRVSHSNYQIVSSSATCVLRGGTCVITGGSATTVTVPTPSASINGTEITFIAGSAQAHIVNAGAAIIYHGTGTAHTTGTLTAQIGSSLTLVSYGGTWQVKASNQTVTYA
jgi:hypothetical protein